MTLQLSSATGVYVRWMCAAHMQHLSHGPVGRLLLPCDGIEGVG